jgi:hypothetical protein
VSSPGSGGAGTLNVSIYEDNGSGNFNNGTGWQSLQTAIAFTCSYSIAPDGRMTLSGDNPACSQSPVFYLTSGNAGLSVGQGASPDFGAIEPQANITFDSGTLSGPFFTGPLGVVSQSQETDIGEVTLASGGGTSASDRTSTTDQSIDETEPVSYTVNSDGTVTTTKSGVPIVNLIIINSNRFVMLNNVTDTYPYVVIGQK